MRFSTFLKQWNPPQYRKYVREKELSKEELPTQVPWLGIEEVHKVSVLINNPVLLA